MSAGTTPSAPGADPMLPDAAVISASNLAHLVDFYWVTLSSLQNVLEDIEGADGRLEYLKSLRFRLIECLQWMDGILSGGMKSVSLLHALAFALQNGVAFLGLSGPALTAALGIDEDLGFAEMQARLRRFGQAVVARLPGTIPAAQQGAGQREVLRAMRGWSAAAERMGEDLSFLAGRLREL